VGEGGGDVADCRGHEGICFCFWFGVDGVPFSDVGEGGFESGEVDVFAHYVPSSFEDEGADPRKGREVLSAIGGGVTELADHGGFFAVAAFDREDYGGGEEAGYSAEDLVEGCVGGGELVGLVYVLDLLRCSHVGENDGAEGLASVVLFEGHRARHFNKGGLAGAAFPDGNPDLDMTDVFLEHGVEQEPFCCFI